MKIGEWYTVLRILQKGKGVAGKRTHIRTYIQVHCAAKCVFLCVLKVRAFQIPSATASISATGHHSFKTLTKKNGSPREAHCRRWRSLSGGGCGFLATLSEYDAEHNFIIYDAFCARDERSFGYVWWYFFNGMKKHKREKSVMSRSTSAYRSALPARICAL